MDAVDILSQLPRLSSAEREVIRAQLDAIDSAAPLSPEEKRLVDERVAACRQNPSVGITWSVAEADVRKQLGCERKRRPHAVGQA